jgi:hypothetical protein
MLLVLWYNIYLTEAFFNENNIRTDYFVLETIKKPELGYLKYRNKCRIE